MTQPASIETVAEYWNRRPCNVRHSPSEVGSRRYFDEVEQRKYFVEPHIPAFAEFGRWKGKRVLEIGCGIGTDAVNFARAGADYTGVELSKASLALACRRFEVFGLRGRLIEGNAEELSPSSNPRPSTLSIRSASSTTRLVPRPYWQKPAASCVRTVSSA